MAPLVIGDPVSILPLRPLAPIPDTPTLHRHPSRLTSEAAGLHLLLKESNHQRDHLQRLVGEMSAEMQRLAAEAAVGPAWVLSKDMQARGEGGESARGRIKATRILIRSGLILSLTP